ncbi:MAG: hypothetical protein ACFFCW_14730 [Candidatus Hodarchaeota archaeon]
MADLTYEKIRLVVAERAVHVFLEIIETSILQSIAASQTEEGMTILRPVQKLNGEEKSTIIALERTEG